MNSKRQLNDTVNPIEDIQLQKKICTLEYKENLIEVLPKQQVKVLNFELSTNMEEKLEKIIKQENLSEFQKQQQYNNTSDLIIIPFSNTNNDSKLELILIQSTTQKQSFYIQSLNQLFQYTQKNNNNFPYKQLANNSYFSEKLSLEGNKQYQYCIKLINSTDKQDQNQHINYFNKLNEIISINSDQYYPGLNIQFEDSISKRSVLNTENLNFEYIDKELEKIDPIEEKFKHHEKKNSKIVIKQIIEYYNLQFQQLVQPTLPSLEQALTIQKLDNTLETVPLEGICYSYVIENLVNTICNIYICENICWAQKQNKINEISSLYYKQQQQMTEEQKIQEISLVFYMVASKLCAEVCQDQQNSQQAATILQKMIKINPIYFENQLRQACDLTPIYSDREDPNYDDLIKERKKVCVKNMPIFFTNSHPVKIVKGAFQYLYDDHGRTFIDCANNVQHVGHNHPRVAKAGCEQIVKFNSNTRFLNPNIIEYAKNLTKTAFHPSLNVCMFVNSGSEANDMALNIARTISGSYEIIIIDHSYHGTTTAVEQISETKFNSKGGHGQQPFIHMVDMPDQYRGKYHYDDPECGEKFALQVKQKIDELKAQGKKPAGFICESLPAVGGMTTLPKKYLQNVYKYIREAGGICIADEVQVGFGRVSKHWWAYELQDVVPDIVVIGKPMGNGHPVAGLIMTEEIANKFNNGQPYFNTYGGNPVSMKIANEVLNVIVEEKMMDNAGIVGQFLFQGLVELRNKYDIVGDVRGEGLFIGIELVKDKTTQEPAPKEAEIISNQLKNRGFIMLHEGYLKNVLKIKPALTYSLENSRSFLRTFEEILINKQW